MKKKNDVLLPLQTLAFDVLRTLIGHAGKSGKFKAMVTINIGAEEKPVLLLGKANGLPFEDGDAIAVLNPDESLYDRLTAGTSYAGPLLTEIVSGKCDAMVHVWLDAYKPKEIGESVIASYVARAMLPAKQVVR